MKMIKIINNEKEFFEKLEIIKKIYWLKTNPKAILHLMNIAIENNKNFAFSEKKDII